MGFKFRADQLSDTLPTTRHRHSLDVWAQAQNLGVWYYSLVTPERVLSEYNKDLIFVIKILFYFSINCINIEEILLHAYYYQD